MLQHFAKIAAAQDILRKAAGDTKSKLPSAPIKRLATGAVLAGTAQMIGSGLNKSKEYRAGFYPYGVDD